MRGSETLARVVRVREALADGDTNAAVLLLADLEADLRPGRRSAICPECGSDCQWPGLLDDHLRVHHPGTWEATVAA